MSLADLLASLKAAKAGGGQKLLGEPSIFQKLKYAAMDNPKTALGIGAGLGGLAGGAAYGMSGDDEEEDPWEQIKAKYGK